jgi:hypothetical protein
MLMSERIFNFDDFRFGRMILVWLGSGCGVLVESMTQTAI